MGGVKWQHMHCAWGRGGLARPGVRACGSSGISEGGWSVDQEVRSICSVELASYLAQASHRVAHPRLPAQGASVPDIAAKKLSDDIRFLEKKFTM